MFRSILVILVLLLAFGSACSKKQVKLYPEDTDQEALDKCLYLSQKKRFEESVECLELVKSRYASSPVASEAELKIADNYYRNKEWLLAAETYKIFVQLHPSSPKLDYAYYRAGLAYSRKVSKKIDRDQSYLKEAEDSFTMVLRLFPSSPYAKLAASKLGQMRGKGAEKHFYVGRFYYKFGEYRAAIPRFIAILQDYPDTPWEEDALYYLVLSYHKLRMQDKVEAALSLMEDKYADSKKTKELRKKVKS
ncbi:MAG: outer membrane protein assembly factor BamD [Deltaproteobacteria bacterium]|nr:outer membrane protein assembly factor BamD [Deltaproteobacteria bacterium]